jgi:hypothetical protein
VINGSRRARIAKGSGNNIEAVNKLMKQFEETRKMMKMMGDKTKMQNMMRRCSRCKACVVDPNSAEPQQAGLVSPVSNLADKGVFGRSRGELGRGRGRTW